MGNKAAKKVELSQRGNWHGVFRGTELSNKLFTIVDVKVVPTYGSLMPSAVCYKLEYFSAPLMNIVISCGHQFWYAGTVITIIEVVRRITF